MRRRTLLCTVSAAVASIAGCSTSSDDRDAPSDNENGVLGESVWEHNIPGQGLILSQNTVFGREVSLSAEQQDSDISGGVFSLDAETGEHQWTYGSSNYLSGIDPRAVTDAVYITESSDDGSFWTSAIEFDGTERWSDISGTLEYITGNTAYLIEGLSSEEPVIRAIDTSTGSEVWNAPGSSIVPETATTNTPDTVYVAGDQLVALDTADGSARWRYEHGNAESDIHVVSNGIVYVTLDRGVVVAVSGGEELWRVDSGFRTNVHSPMNNLALITDRNHIRAFDAVTGEQQWAQEPLGGVQTYNSDRVYVSKIGSSGNRSTVSALALDDGSEIWSIEVGTEDERERVNLKMNEEGNTSDKHFLFVQVGERKLKKVDSNGEVAQTWVPEKKLYDFLVDDFLIVSTDSGIHALDSY